ncbi:HNH endonuclease signature motif containing protein [Pseudomonas typographi]|uniref:HNH endonuclease n=1 Tax=Pseudomonas typographi TaxID=2715964 RepID=A0ABR7Z6K3_9PSED|nr:HNH endonuclease signature motif containing protein [Pseudomonas typographi]MBD1601151.1 HNH endonuclease [Pseudomonas typographi]
MAKRIVKKWTEVEDKVLREHYSSSTKLEILALLPGRSDAAIGCRACAFGLKKDPAVRSEQSRAAFADTCARLGRMPGRCDRPIGATHRKGRYTLIKIAQPDVWKPLHIHTWEIAHGPVPEGMQVSARDGNPRNVSPDNLCLRTLGEIHLRTHSRYRGLPEEVLDVLHLQNEIRKTIKRKRGNEK